MNNKEILAKFEMFKERIEISANLIANDNIISAAYILGALRNECLWITEDLKQKETVSNLEKTHHD